MRLLNLALFVVLLGIQYPLWLGKGGWLRVWDMEGQVATQQSELADLRTRNAALDAEVADLKSGTEAIEERARFELGMVHQNEVFVQLVDVPPGGLPPMPTATPPAATARPATPAAPAARPAAPAPRAAQPVTPAPARPSGAAKPYVPLTPQ